MDDLNAMSKWLADNKLTPINRLFSFCLPDQTFIKEENTWN